MNALAQPGSEPNNLMVGVDLDTRQKFDHPRILIIDDDTDLITLLKITLRKAGFDVASAVDYTSAQATGEVNPHVILLDLTMPDLDGWSIYQRLREITSAPIIILTASANQDYAAKCLEMGAQDYIAKPFYGPELIARIKNVFRQFSTGQTADKHERSQ